MNDIGKEDLRVIRTRMLLKNALTSMLAEKSLEQISVMDICDRAMVHRATFYKHFEDKYHLFSYLLDDIERSFIEYGRRVIDTAHPEKAYITIADGLLTFMLENKKILVSIIENNRNEATFNIFYREIENNLTAYLESVKRYDDVKQEYPTALFSSFLSGGFLSLAYWWLNNNDKCSKEQILSFLEKFIIK